MKLLKSVRDLTNVGFTYLPEQDFSDDGNYFRMYEYEGLIISYLKADGMFYISVRLDYDRDLDYDEYSELPHYELADEFNGVNVVDVDKLVENMKILRKEYNAKVAEINATPINVDAIKEEFEKESELFEKKLNELRKCDWLSPFVDTDRFGKVKLYIKSLNNYKRQCYKTIYSDKPIEGDHARALRQFAKEKSIWYDEDYYNVKAINSLIEDCKEVGAIIND